MTANTYPSLPEAIELNPAMASAYNYYQDDGFGGLMCIYGLCFDDRNMTHYIHAFLERDGDTIPSPIYYGSH